MRNAEEGRYKKKNIECRIMNVEGMYSACREPFCRTARRELLCRTARRELLCRTARRELLCRTVYLIKKTERSDSILRNSAVRYSAVLRFAVQSSDQYRASSIEHPETSNQQPTASDHQNDPNDLNHPNP